MTSTSRSKITPAREQEFYRAALDLLREGGYDALTMEGVAARTRCGKSTLYRQWGSKSRLVAAALRGNRCGRLADVDTGTLAGDLAEVVHVLAERSHQDTALTHALGHAAQQDPELLCALRETLIEPEVAAIDAMVHRAVARGEVAAGTPAAVFVPAQLIGVLRARPLLEGRRTRQSDEAYLRRFVEASVLPALGLRDTLPAAAGASEAVPA